MAVTVIWVLLAGAVGLLIASQSLLIIFMALVLCAILLLALFHPLVILAVMLILAPMRTLIATEAEFQLPLDVGQIGLFGVLAIWVLHTTIFHRHLPRIYWSPLHLPLLLLLALISFNAFSALTLSNWITEWIKWVQIILMITLTLQLARGSSWQWLLFGLVLAGCANALIGLYQFLGGSGADHLLINDRFFRAFGTFGQPNPFAGFLGLLTPMAAMAAAGYGCRWWSGRGKSPALLLMLYYLFASGLLILGVLASWSRGAWLGLIVATGIILFALPHKIQRGAVLAGLSLVTIGVLWYIGAIPQSVIMRINSSTEEIFTFQDVRGVDITPENYAVVERLSHWQAAVNMAREYPWLGVGLGNYEIAYPHYRLLNWTEPLGHAHNYYLNILAEVGFLGLITYLSVWGSVFFLTWKARCHPDPLSRMIVIGLLGAWSYLSVHSLFDNLYVNNIFLHLGLMLGILAVLHNQITGTRYPRR
jgi:putative inorganic carbon (HCO3(-)) transporter